jgi:hypothetical protein
MGDRSVEQRKMPISPLRPDFRQAQNGYGRNASWLDKAQGEPPIDRSIACAAILLGGRPETISGERGR